MTHEPLPYLVTLAFRVDADTLAPAVTIRTIAYSMLEAVAQAMLQAGQETGQDPTACVVQRVTPDLVTYAVLKRTTVAPTAAPGMPDAAETPEPRRR